MVPHQSVPLAGRRPIICCQLGVSHLWERSLFSFGSRISAKKVEIILDYLPGSKAQDACSSLGVMKPCSRNHFGTHLECLKLCALGALSVETQVTQHHRPR